MFLTKHDLDDEMTSMKKKTIKNAQRAKFVLLFPGLG